MEIMNQKFESGRIGLPEGDLSKLVSNKDTDLLLDNIEDGVKELAIKFIESGYDLFSSCQGHPPEVCNSYLRVLKIGIEKSNVTSITKKINHINYTNGTTIHLSISSESHAEKLTLANRYGKNQYDEIEIIYIVFGRYDECEFNYNTMIKEFYKYNW